MGLTLNITELKIIFEAEFGISSTADMAKGNHRNCLSAKRGLGKCHKCDSYPHCDSKIAHAKYDELMAKRKEMLAGHDKEHSDINTEIDAL